MGVRYEVVPTASLTPASGDLQPRERGTRLSSDAQIQNIAANLDPSRLMRSPEADRGAPIVGPDNIIESGNGRIQAIQQAHAANPDKYAAYIQALRDAGHVVPEGEGPHALVARRTSELSPADRQAFVQEANQSATQRMSAAEQARVDGGKLTSGMLANYDHNQDPTSAANRAFVRDWVSTLPEAERNAVLDAHGQLSSEGARRLSGAMLARAYDDPGTLARGLESTDDATRSISGGLADAAPAWAKLRAGIEAGNVPKAFDTSKELVQAADLVRQAREKKQSMSDILNQQDAFNPLSPITEQYIRALYNPAGPKTPAGVRAASRPAIADVLKRYAEEAQRQDTSPGLFGESEAVKPIDALRTIVAKRDVTDDPTANTQGRMLDRGGQPVAENGPTEENQPPADHAAAAATPSGTTRPPLGGVRPQRDFNAGITPFRQVFRDAGLDPDLWSSRPIKDQLQVITRHIQKTFGFKAVLNNERQQTRGLVDQLSNFYQNAREMAHALGMPYEAIGLDGRLTLATKAYTAKNQALGTYAPGSRTIELPGRSNSFAHEWTHALDHYLADALANNPKAMRLLSMTSGIQQTPATVAGRLVKVDTPAEAFVGVLQTMYGGDAPTAAEALNLQLKLRSGKPAEVLAATRRLEAIETKFAKSSRKVPNGVAYWSAPHEMLARAHEAYVSHLIQLQGGDTRAVAKPYYDAQGKPNGFEQFYPQLDERMHIFQAFTDLHDALRRQNLLGAGIGARPDGLDIVDPVVWDKMANTKQAPGLVNALRREVQAQKNWRKQVWDRLGYNDRAANPGNLTVGTRAMDSARNMFGSIRGIGNVLTARQPAGAARDNFQHIMDLISPAESVRDPAKAAGRYFGPVFEEEVREHARPNINRMANILDQHGLADMTPMEKLMLRHTMTEGRDDSFIPPNEKNATPIYTNISKAGGDLRHLLNLEWQRNQDAGMKIGYARNGYFPRMYDDHKIFGDRPGFEAAGTKLHRVIFEQAVGDDPAKLLAAHDRLPKEVRDNLPPQVQNDVVDLRANLKQQDRLRDGLAQSADPAADQDAIDRLQDEARDLHDAIHDEVRDAYATHAAREWWLSINEGDPTDFDTRGPNAGYLNKRVLPPETDTIMRDYMVSDPTVALPRYFQQSARKVAFNKRFGVNGTKLDTLLRGASDAGARGEDVEAMRRLVQAVTGRQKGGLPPPVERAMNVVHALGSIALMPRAAWSSLSEPMATLARTESFKAMFDAFANQLGDIVNSAGSQHRADLANALGLTTSHLYDSIIADRTDGHYRDAPGLSTLMAHYYRRTGLTQLTNSQRRSVMGAGHIALDAWSKDVLGKDARRQKDARAQFRDLGIPDAQHEALAKWVTAHPGLPSLADLQTPGGKLWGQAVSRLTDKIIQDPMRVDKPLMSQNPVGRLAYGLMSFNYAFYHNVIEHALETHSERIKENYQDARASGAGRFKAAGATARPIGRATLHIGASAAGLYLASLLTTTLRERLFNGDKWDEQAKNGTLADWLSDLAIQRTGVNGPLDPLIQAITGLKYSRDLSSLAAGAQVGYFLQAAGDMLKPFAGLEANTNTAQYNAIKGAWNMFGVPAAGVALTALPGGPLTSALAGAALQGLTSRGAADTVATSLVGPKGTGPGGEPPPEKKPPDPNAEPQGTGSGLLGGVPLGMADDVAAPAARVAAPLWSRLPRAGKVGVAGAVGLGAASGLARAFGQWKEQ